MERDFVGDFVEAIACAGFVPSLFGERFVEPFSQRAHFAEMTVQFRSGAFILRVVVQLVRTARLGREGRRFKSVLPDITSLWCK